MGLYGSLDKSEVEHRARALARFAEWEERSRIDYSASVAIEGVAFLWELLPHESRERPPDPSGVRRMHAILGQLRSR